MARPLPAGRPGPALAGADVAAPAIVRAGESSAVDTSRGGLRVREFRTLALAGGDVLAFGACALGAFLFGSAVRNALFDDVGYFETGGALQVATVFAPAFAMLLWRSWNDGHYTRYLPTLAELRGLCRSVAVIAAVTALVLFALKSHFSRLWFSLFLGSLLIVVPTVRALVKRGLIRLGWWFRPTWIVGAGEEAVALARAVESDASLGHRVVGYVDDRATSATASDGRPIACELPAVGGRPPERRGRARGAEVELSFVFAYASLAEYERHRELVDAHTASNASISIVPPRYGPSLHDAEIANVYRHETTLLRVRNNIANPRARLVKRTTDVALGGVLLLLASPLLAAIALGVRLDGGPALYRHRRIGARGRPFHCLKFRSMRADADRLLAEHLVRDPDAAREWRATRKLRHDPRLTRIGALLRKTSLDELPQLWNVLRGEMSLVGPRPIVEDEREHYATYLAYYLQMVPGITGLWQVSGRSDTSYAQRVELDVWYARHWSLWTDLVILVQTLPALLARRGAY